MQEHGSGQELTPAEVATWTAEWDEVQERIEGHLGPHWADWFGGLTVTLDHNGEMLLSDPVVDQSALHAVLRKVRDLGMPLLSVTRVKPGQSEGPDANETHRARPHEEQ